MNVYRDQREKRVDLGRLLSVSVTSTHRGKGAAIIDRCEDGMYNVLGWIDAAVRCNFGVN